MKKRSIIAGTFCLIVAAALCARQSGLSDEGGRILGLEKAWNHALEEKDANALDMILASNMFSVDIDGSIQNKGEFLASIKSPDYKPSQVVTENTSIQVYGNAAVVVGIFRVKGMEKGKPYTHRERFTDTWIKINGDWQCVATQATLITASSTGD